MHKSIIFVLIFTTSCKTIPSSTAPILITDAEIQIAKKLIQGVFDDVWGGVDSTKILNYHTEDFIILEQGKVWDNDSIRTYIRGQLAREDRPKRINIMDYISINKYGESMQIAYRNHADFVRADTIATTANWMESALAVKTKEGWRLKMMHSTWAGRG